jgi:hypothetical protein
MTFFQMTFFQTVDQVGRAFLKRQERQIQIEKEFVEDLQSNREDTVFRQCFWYALSRGIAAPAKRRSR